MLAFDIESFSTLPTQADPDFFVTEQTIAVSSILYNEACGLVVPGASELAELGIKEFLNGYGFLLLSNDPWE